MTTGPKADEPVGYAAHIRPLFRPGDLESMSFAFDLGSYDDVSDNADHILQRLRSGTMPCDGAWPRERIELFDRWIRGGKHP